MNYLLKFLFIASLLGLGSPLTAADKVFPGKKSKWNGFDMYKDGGRMVVAPAKVADGKPWVWRARFFGHEPQFDVALLKRGYHLVYCNVGGLYGNNVAVERWNGFYKYLHEEHGFAEKAVLEGMSRGGLIIYNWGISNPEKVAVIYGDAPVMDFKSWPGHANRGILKAYGFKNAEEAKAYQGNPVDNLKPLAKAGVPIIHVVGDADKVVPVSENTAIAEKRYKELGGTFKVIHKEKVGHHPHSLKDPAPLVDFVLKHEVRGSKTNGRFLYMSTPDGAQKAGSSDPGILVFAIDDGHKFVRRIDVPVFSEGIRGFTGCTATKCLYYSTTGGTLGCFDLTTEEVKWQSKFKQGCDRSCITPDGKRIYAPTGWWWRSDKDGFIVVDAATGKKIDQIAVNKRAHNSIASLDGNYVYLGTEVTLTQFRARDGKALQTISPVGESGVFPFTVNSANTRAYVCLGRHAGFDVVDLEMGKVTDRIFAKDPKTGKKIRHRTHGAGMNPEETELWISDQTGRKLFIFDLTKAPPAPKGHVDLSMGGHGWVTFSLDGAYAYCHTPDVFDARSKKKVATLTSANGKPFASSKFIEVQFTDGKVSKISNEFGLGRVHHK